MAKNSENLRKCLPNIDELGLQNPSGKQKVRRIGVMLLVVVLVAGVATISSYGLKKSVYDDSPSAIEHMRKFKTLLGLTGERKYTWGADMADGQDGQKEISAPVRTNYAIIYTHEGIDVPEFLVSDFDRIFEMVARYFKIKLKGEKLVIWVVDFYTLQELSLRIGSGLQEAPYRVACLFVRHQNCFFFTPRFMNELYVAHELIHYFIHEYPGKVAVALPQAIARHNLTGFPLEDFIRRHEEKIAQELSLIIVRKNLASFALRSAQWEKVDQQNVIMRNEIKGGEE